MIEQVERVRIKASRVDPIKRIEDIQRLKEYYVSNYRHGELYELILTLGINTGLRAGDLLSLKVGDIRNRTHIEIIEQKTKKPRRIFINKQVERSVESYLKRYMFIENHSYLFYGQKGVTLDVRTVHKLVKRGCKELKLDGNYGSHTMRKTFAYHAYQYSRNLPLIRDLFNHSDTHVTRIYVGNDIENTKDASKDMIICSEDEIYQNVNL